MENESQAGVTVGMAPPDFRLPAATRLGLVRFQIGDLERSTRFYRDVIGLRAGKGTHGSVVLSAQGDDRPLIELVERADARPVPPGGRLGLYHVALLLPDRANLGCFIRHANEVGVRLGAADHLVSEAVYLNDPDGLGLEVYADRPREAWDRGGSEIRMATNPLDVQSLVYAAARDPWSGAPAGTTIGHVHLNVGDIDRASAFYHDALGFDKIAWSYPGALFLSAGGYHHHLGTNVWARGASPAGEEDARLLEWSVIVPSLKDVDTARYSMQDAGRTTVTAESSWSAADPWGTVVRVVTYEDGITHPGIPDAITFR